MCGVSHYLAMQGQEARAESGFMLAQGTYDSEDDALASIRVVKIWGRDRE